MENKKPVSPESHKSQELPCNGVCYIDDQSGYCIGCSRTEEEVYKWEDETTSAEWRKQLIKTLKRRAL